MENRASRPYKAEMELGTRDGREYTKEHPAIRIGSSEAHRRSLHALPRLSREVPGSLWSASVGKRVFDLLAAGAVLVLASPFLLFIGLLVRATSPGPAIFRQKRVGMHGVEFTIYKFRTMLGAEGSKRSSHGDHRLTSPGRWLRKYKLDELPQLWNVCRGEMSLVGPRPKLHGHHTVDTCFRPGITGAATLAFAAEEHLLRDVHHSKLEETHTRLISPRKLELDFAYMGRATFRSDLLLLWKTLIRADRVTDLQELMPREPIYVSTTAAPPPERSRTMVGAGSAPGLLPRTPQGRGAESLSI